MEYIIAPLVLEARRRELDRPEVRYRQEWETSREADRYGDLYRRAQSRLGDATPYPAN